MPDPAPNPPPEPDPCRAVTSAERQLIAILLAAAVLCVVGGLVLYLLGPLVPRPDRPSPPPAAPAAADTRPVIPTTRPAAPRPVIIATHLAAPRPVPASRPAAPRPAPSPPPPHAATQPSLPPGVISWKVAARYIGKTLTVEGRVVETYLSPVDQVLVLSFDQNRTGFYVLVQPEALAGLPAHADHLFLNRTIRVTGKIFQHGRRTQMRIYEAGQISLVRKRELSTR